MYTYNFVHKSSGDTIHVNFWCSGPIDIHQMPRGIFDMNAEIHSSSNQNLGAMGSQHMRAVVAVGKTNSKK